MSKRCTIADCENKHIAKGYCDNHYKKLSNPKLRSPEYVAWVNMKSRCYNKNLDRYTDYGGRGIKVCERWLGEDGYTNFLLDMGERPSVEHSLDRVNNDGNYEPDNCRWATEKQQQNNRRVTVTSSTGILNVHKDSSGYTVIIRGKYIGHFKSIVDAVTAKQEYLA